MRDERYQLEQPVRGKARGKAADRVGNDRFSGQLRAVQRLHHGSMGGKIPAPAHAHRGENGDVVRVHKAGGRKLLYDARRCAGGTERGDRDGDRVGS